MTPLLGWRTPDREHVRLSAWAGGWIGLPQRVRLRYNRASVNTEHPRWMHDVTATVTRMLGEGRDVAYVVVRHTPRKGQLNLESQRTLIDPVDDRPAEQRATRILREVLGPTTTLSAARLSDDVEATGQRQLYSFTVHHQAGTRVATPAQRARIERTVSTMLPGRWRARWQLENDSIHFELRPSLPTRVPHPRPGDRIDRNGATPADVLDSYDQVQIPLAVDEDGETVYWRPAIDPHLLAVGASGTGKTVLMQGVLTEIAAWGWPVFVNDAKGVEFLGFRQWPNVRNVATTTGEQVANIHAVWRIMEERYDAIIQGRASENDFEPVVLLLDEFRDFWGELLDWYSRVRVTGKGGDPTRPPVLEKVKSIARKGRTARVHLVLGTQRPDAEFLSGEARDNFRARISLGRLSPQGSMMMWDSYSAAVTVPRGIRGRGITLDDNDRPCEIQTFWTPDPRKVGSDDVDDLQILENLYPRTTRHEQMLIVPPEVHPDGDVDEPRYRQWADAFLHKENHTGSTEHLRHIARIVPLTQHPELAPRCTMSPAMIDIADRHSSQQKRLTSATSPHHSAAADSSTEQSADAVMVEPDPSHTFIRLDIGDTSDTVRNRDDETDETDETTDKGFSVRVEAPRATTVVHELSPGPRLSTQAIDLDDAESDDPFTGYGPVQDLLVHDLEVGMLVLLDEDSNTWVALEDEPQVDVDDDTVYLLDWRDDNDETGSCHVDVSSLISTRTPLDDPKPRWDTSESDEPTSGRTNRRPRNPPTGDVPQAHHPHLHVVR